MNKPMPKTSPPLATTIPSTAIIKGIRQLSHDTMLYLLRLIKDRMSASFTFTPGQFVQFSVPSAGEIPISLAGAPQDENTIELCIRKVGHVTSMAHRLEMEAPVGVRGPFGNGFPLDQWKGRNILLIAGGLGIAPLRSLLLYLLQNRAGFGEITLMYGARNPATLLFGEELSTLSCGGDFRLLMTVDFLEGEAPRGLSCKTGLLTDLVTRTRFPTDNTVAAVCGPPALYRCLVGELVRMGISESDIYLSLERRMKCGTGLCCHCAIGDLFCCTDGPVFRYRDVRHVTGAV